MINFYMVIILFILLTPIILDAEINKKTIKDISYIRDVREELTLKKFNKKILEDNKDYSVEAKKFLEKREPYKSKDINDIIYEAISKEIQEGKHD